MAQNSGSVSRYSHPTVVTLLLSPQTARRRPPTARLPASQFSLLFSPEIRRSGPLIASNQPQRSQRHPTRPLNPPTTFRQSLKHRRNAIIRGEYFVRLEEGTVDKRWTEGSPTPTLPLRSPPLGPPNDKDIDHPHAVVLQVSPRARKSMVSRFLDERVHPLPANLVDQTLLPPTDHHATAFHHPPAPSRLILATSPTPTHPGPQQN